MAPSQQKKAPWIVVTGMDGSGTSTLQTNLVEALKKDGSVFAFHVAYSDFVIPSLGNISLNNTPVDDPYTERLLFALDARLTNYRLIEWRNKHDFVVSARGWMDAFIYGAAQKFSYQQTADLLKINELEKPSAIIYLTCDIEVVLQRMKRQPRMPQKEAVQKYETAEFLTQLRANILDFIQSTKERDPALQAFSDIPQLHLDTSNSDIQAVSKSALSFLHSGLNTPL